MGSAGAAARAALLVDLVSAGSEPHVGLLLDNTPEFPLWLSAKIQSCWVALGARSRSMDGIAKKRTETSIETRRRGSRRTTKAVHSLRPARSLRSVVVLVAFVMPGNIRTFKTNV